MDYEEMEALLSADPLLIAEEMTGRSYKEDKHTADLGMLLQLDLNRKRESALIAAGDTTWSGNLQNMLTVLDDEGFDQVFERSFSTSWGREALIYLWHPEGILAKVESWRLTKVNTADILFNLQLPDFQWMPHCSGYFSKLGEHVFVGHMDVRVGVRHRLAGLRAAGRFINPWLEAYPSTGLADRAQLQEDYRGFKLYDLPSLPEEVRACIDPDGSLAEESAHE